MNFFRSRRIKKSVPQQEMTIFALSWFSIKTLYTRIQTWIPVNCLYFLFLLGIITIPSATRALNYAVREKLIDFGNSSSSIRESMRVGFAGQKRKTFALVLSNATILILILLSIYFWIRVNPYKGLRYVSVISIYFLYLWWNIALYLFPVFLDYPDDTIPQIFKKCWWLTFRFPFETLWFSFCSALAFLLGTLLLGPILLIIPAFQCILAFHAYWFLTGKEIPGLNEVKESYETRSY